MTTTTTTTTEAAKETAASSSEAQVNGQHVSNGSVTREDEYRRKVSAELSEAYRELGRAQMRLERCKSEQKSAKAEVESAQAEVNDLASELRDIELGQYQPDLFDKKPGGPESNGAAAAGDGDEGLKQPLECLSEFPADEKGRYLTERDIEMVKASPNTPKTIGELEAWFRSDEHWNRKIKGFGEKKIEMLKEAHRLFRLKFPFPEENDGE